MARKKLKAIGPVPQNLAEANNHIFRIGQFERQVAGIERDLEDEVAKLRKKADEKVKVIAGNVGGLVTGLQAFAEANRDVILPNGAKTAILTAGKIGWRFTPPKVSLGKNGDARVLKYLIENKLNRFIRVVKEVNRERMLEERPEIPGVKYTQKENFFVEPEPVVDGDTTAANVVFLGK